MSIATIENYKKAIANGVKNIDLKRFAKKLNFDGNYITHIKQGSVVIYTKTLVDKDRLSSSINISIHNADAEISTLAFNIDECEYSKLRDFIKLRKKLKDFYEFKTDCEIKINVSHLITQSDPDELPEVKHITITHKPEGFEFSIYVGKKCYTKALINNEAIIDFLYNKLDLGYQINTTHKDLQEPDNKEVNEMTIPVNEYKKHLIENLNKISKFAKYYSYTRDLSIVERSTFGEDEYATYFYNKFVKYSANDYISIAQQLKYSKYILKSQVFLNLSNKLIVKKVSSSMTNYILFPNSCIPKLLKFLDSISTKKSSKIKLDVLFSTDNSYVISDECLNSKKEDDFFIPRKAKLEINSNGEYINFVLETLDKIDSLFDFIDIHKPHLTSVTFLKNDIVPYLYNLLKMSNEINSVFSENIGKKDITVTIPYSSDLNTSKYIAELMYKREAIPIKNIKSYLSDLVKGIELYPNYLKIDADINNNLFSFYLTNNPDELENDIAYIEEQLKNKTSLIWENCDINSSRIHKEMQLHVGWNVIGKIKRSDILQILKIAKQVLNDKITQCVNELNK